MDREYLKKLIEKHIEIVSFANYGNGVSEDWIISAQNRLNVIFPPSYIWWLLNYGGGEINGEEIFSIYEMDFDSVIGGDIVYMNELNRKNNLISLNQLIIMENGFGEIYYFDLLTKTETGEYSIYLLGLEKKYADNFYEFLEKQILEH
jgi:antitoxin YobK